MSDPSTPEPIDALAARAVATLRRDVARRPLPELRLRRSYRWLPAATAFATAAVLIVGLIVIGGRDRTVAGDPSEVRWLLRDLPSGWSASLVEESTSVTAQAGPPAAFVPSIYATDASPLGPTLSVYGTTGDAARGMTLGSYSANALGYEETSLDGKRAAFVELPNGRGLYVEIDGQWVYLSSTGLDDDTLAGLAKTLTADSGERYEVAASALPEGMREIAWTPNPSPPLSSVRIEYVPSPEANGSLSLYVGDSEPDFFRRASIGFEFRAVSLNGVTGYMSETSPGPLNPLPAMFMILWRRDGLDFSVSGTGLTREQALAAAASASRATAREWATLALGEAQGATTTAATGTTAPVTSDPPKITPRDVPVAVTVEDVTANEQRWSGVLPTGESWNARIVRVYDKVDFHYWIDGTLVESGLGTRIPPAAEAQVTCCNPVTLTTDPNAYALRILRSNGDRYTIPLHNLPGPHNVRVALIAIPGGTLLAELIDADGGTLRSYAPR